MKTRNDFICVEILKEELKTVDGIWVSTEVAKDTVVKAKIKCIPDKDGSTHFYYCRDLKINDHILIYRPKCLWHKELCFIEEEHIIAIL